MMDSIDPVRERLERSTRAYFTAHRSYHAGFYSYASWPLWYIIRYEKKLMAARQKATDEGRDLSLSYRPSGMK